VKKIKYFAVYLLLLFFGIAYGQGVKKDTTFVTICESDLPYIHDNGFDLYTGGEYIDTTVDAEGVTYVRTLLLTTIPTTYYAYDTVILKESLPLIRDGVEFWDQGVYIDTITNSMGCDSVRTLLLTVYDDYYTLVEGLSGDALKVALHNIIKGHKEYPYTSSSTDTWDILKETDKDTTNTENVILFYTGWSMNAALEYNNAQGWSREHVWAKSHGSFDTDIGVGTDAHNLRPADISVNSARNNKDFDDGGDIYIDGDGTTSCRSDADSWEARDEVKGDVARILFYMATRYEGDNDEPDLELVDQVNTYDLNETGKGYHGKLSTLLKWNIDDPVDSFEINRNNVIYTYQGNRNPFVDHPEYVDQIWGIAMSTGEIIRS